MGIKEYMTTVSCEKNTFSEAFGLFLCNSDNHDLDTELLVGDQKVTPCGLRTSADTTHLYAGVCKRKCPRSSNRVKLHPIISDELE